MDKYNGMSTPGADHGWNPTSASFCHEGLSSRLLGLRARAALLLGRNKSAPFSAAPLNLANRHDYYSFKRKDGTIEHSLEDRIGHEIESPGLPVIAKLSSGKLNLSHDERYKLARLVALQSIRVPYERDFIDSNARKNLLEYLSDMDADSQRLGHPVNAIEVGTAPRDDPRIMKRAVLHRRAIMERLRQMDEDPLLVSREGIFGIATHIAKELMTMKWSVSYASGKMQLITSDRPVAKIFSDGNSVGRGVRDLRCEITFPISGTALLQMKHHNWLPDAVKKRRPNEPTHRRSAPRPMIETSSIGGEEVQKKNELHAQHAHLWVFSSSRLDWLTQWTQLAMKAPKEATIIQDAHELVRGSRGTKIIMRKREYVVSHD
jgi:hypothetical protein